MKKIYVFYDGECVLCRRVREWLARQPAYIELVFLPFQSEAARRLCPDLARFHPSDQLIALADDGAIYSGEKAWLICLYALRDYRRWARKLATPALRPLAQRLCFLISHHRLKLSQMLLQHIDLAT